MGSPGSGSADCSVGSIVWVRRRNGSWWPGKILGPEELSVSHLMSPRSGTPVKLLGREDASVDWYNLEKSKRVKAFRCGEFDDCIERVEFSPGMLIKKREKYARREDAILHALELEKQLLNKHGNLSATSDHNCRKSPSGVKKEPITSSGSLGNEKEKYGNSKSHHQFSNKFDTAHQDEIIGSPLCLEKLKKENHLTSEDDNSEATPRMRGLQDFGLRIAPSKRKLLSSAPNGSERPSIDRTSQALPAHGLSMGSASLGNGDHSLNRRKRSNEGLAEAILVKRRDRRRPLVQVMQNSANLGISHPLQPDYGTVSTSISGVGQMGAISHEKRSKCVYLPTEPSESWEYKVPVSHHDISPPQFGEESCRPHLGSFLEENASGFMEDVDSGSFLEENASGFMEDVYSDSSDTNSDSGDDSETEPEMDKKMAVLSVAEADPYVLGSPEAQRDRGILSSEERNEPANSGNIFIHYPPQPVPANEAVVKWSTKRKRNARNLSRGYVDASNRKNLDFGQRTFRHNLGSLGSDDFDDGISDVAYPMLSRYSNKRHDMSPWEDSGWEDEAVLGRYWEDKQEYFDPKFPDHHHHHHVGGGRARFILVDVDLKVQASYQKEPVPIVSLMSKLNGKAIIGHPIQIGILEDGSTDTLLSTVNDFSNETMDDPPAWRTARRTANSRIPRPHFPYAPDNDEATQDHLFLDRDRKPPSKKGSSSHKASASRKKFLKKPPKSSPSSSQKTRTLSSIAVEQKYSSKPKLDSSNCLMDGPLIKQESTGTTTVTCIPVKLVFSRLLEKIKHGSV